MGWFLSERIWTGRELLEVVIGAYGYDFKHDEPSDEYEAEKIASFLQTAQDLGEYGDNLRPVIEFAKDTV